MNDDKIIICRCEDVTLKEIRDIIAEGYTTIEEVKRIARTGMGPCQGKTCSQIIAREICRATGKKMEDLKYPEYRPPFGGVLFDEIIKGDPDEE